MLKGEILVWRGLSRDALSVLEPDLPPTLSYDVVAVRRHIALGLANSFLQQFQVAGAQLAKAEDLSRSHHPELLGEVYLSEGTLLLLQNDLVNAQGQFRRSLEIARREKQSFIEANSLGSLGVVAMRQEHYDEAMDFFHASLDISHPLGNLTQEEKTLGNLGWSYFKLGDFEKALSLFQQATQICTELGLVKDEQIWLSNSGVIYFTLNNLDRGEQNYVAALSIARKLENKALIAITLNNLTDLELARHKFDEAQRFNEEALTLSRANHLQTSELNALINEARISFAQKRVPEAQRHLEDVIQRTDTDLPLRWEAQATLAGFHAKTGQPVIADRLFRRAMTTIDDARSSLNKPEYRLSFLNTAAKFYHDYIDFLISRGRIEDALAVAEHSRARTLAEGLGIKPASVGATSSRPTEIARRQNAIILSYWLKPERSCLWAITPTKVALFPIPADTEINAAVQAYRKALTGPRDPLETASDSGRQLYDMLVAPAQKLITADSRVIVIADGSLHGLNFETLLAPAPKPHYWIEDVTISNANSLAMLGSSSMLPRVRAEPFRANLGGQASPKNLLLIGNPIPASSEFPALPQASEEIRDVGTHFDRDHQTVIDGARATPAAYLASDPEKFSYIHFVAHGTASRLSPLDSAVVLSPQGDAYKLYARDIVEKPLKADLVTVSACYGSGSRAYSGEGLVGLSWAFLRAGAHNVVAALWEANDVSTPKLMDAMYSGISHGDDPATALHDAKLSLLHSDSIYRRPFYWAPFQLYVGSGINPKPSVKQKPS